MEIIRRNLLQTDILEEDISSNTGTVKSIMESPRSSLRRVNPDLVKERYSVIQDTTENLSNVEDGVDYDGRSTGTIEPVQCVPTFCN